MWTCSLCSKRRSSTCSNVCIWSAVDRSERIRLIRIFSIRLCYLLQETLLLHLSILFTQNNKDQYKSHLKYVSIFVHAWSSLTKKLNFKFKNIARRKWHYETDLINFKSWIWKYLITISMFHIWACFTCKCYLNESIGYYKRSLW